MGKLTKEQEQDVARRALAGERYDQIIKDLAAQGIAYSKPAITKLVQRVQRRALAAPLGPPAVDPKTGIEVEVTDDLAIGQVVRKLMQRFHADGCSFEDEITIAHVLPKLATARQRVRQPPTPAPKPPTPPGQPQEPEKPADDELVRFN